MTASFAATNSHPSLTWKGQAHLSLSKEIFLGAQQSTMVPNQQHGGTKGQGQDHQHGVQVALKL